MSPRNRTRARHKFGETTLPCRAKVADGKPCRAHAGPSGYCWAHDPRLAAKRAAAHKMGGRKRGYGGENGSSAPEIQTIEDIRRGLSGVIGRLQAMDNTPEVCRAMISAYGELRSTLETGDLERRLAAIEERLEARLMTGDSHGD